MSNINTNQTTKLKMMKTPRRMILGNQLNGNITESTRKSEMVNTLTARHIRKATNRFIIGTAAIAVACSDIDTVGEFIREKSMQLET